jgi:autotransporter-associated beta strand protein
MKQAWFIIGLTALLAGGTAWAGITSTWTGNGNVDNDGNWSNASNWNNGVPNGATDVAVLPAPTTRTRTVTVDILVTVQAIQMAYSGQINKLSLSANLDVGQFTKSGGSYMNYQVTMNGNTLTLGTGNLTSAEVPNLSGTGTLIKTGTGNATLIYDGWSGFTGTYQVDNGILYGTYARISGSSTILVNSGGTYYVNASAGESPNITLNGTGYSSQGAFRAANCTYGKAINLASDASVAVDASQTLTLNGSFSGSGKLTKIGTGKLLMSGDSSAYTADTSVNAGTLEVSGLFQGSKITVNTGGTLNAPAYRVGTVVLNGGTWNNTAQPEWIKGASYSGNDSGIWSDANNWGTLSLPTTLAILGNVTANGNDGVVTRTITNDAVTTVGELRFVQGNDTYPNVLYLAADLAAGSITMSPANWYRYGITIPAGRTLTITNEATEGLPNLYPSSGSAGTIVKNGSGTVKMVYSPGITWNGTYVANGGTTSLVYDRINNVTYVVNDGATLQVDNTSQAVGGTITLRGSGYNGQGALYASVTPSGTFVPPVTVSNGATIKVASGQTLPLVGALKGTGTTTLIGGGTLDLNNTWTFSIAGATANGIVAKTGTVDIAGCTLTLTNLATSAGGQVVVIDYNWPNGAVVGQFSATNGLPATWSLSRTGTSFHPNAIVLMPPPRGSAIALQ